MGFFGDRCQHYGKGIGLNLDDILRYEIQPNTTWIQQPASVKTSVVSIIGMLVVGLVNSLFSFLTFHQAESREVGCGMYLLASSISSILTMIMFTLKFWFLILTQIDLITNPSVLRGLCLFVEPLLKLFLYLNTWYYACVAAERAITVYQGIKFNKKKSKCVAQWVLLLLPIFIAGSVIHEPWHRELIYNKEKRYPKCVVSYSSTVQYYNTMILFFHFLAPFSTNLFSALFIVFRTASQRSVSRVRSSYRQHLCVQFAEHKQLLISPIILVILSLPRLIISLLSGCIEVSRHSSWYLFGYFVSFIPSLLSFAVFVVPSDLYMNQLKNSTRKWRQRLNHLGTYFPSAAFIPN